MTQDAPDDGATLAVCIHMTLSEAETLAHLLQTTVVRRGPLKRADREAILAVATVLQLRATQARADVTELISAAFRGGLPAWLSKDKQGSGPK